MSKLQTSLAGNLGAVPAIVVSLIITGVKYGLSRQAAAEQAAAQYEAFYRMKEAEVSALALELGRQTDAPYWEWFNILRSIQRLPSKPPVLPGNGTPPPEDKPFPTAALYMGAGVLLLLLITR